MLSSDLNNWSTLKRFGKCVRCMRMALGVAIACMVAVLFLPFEGYGAIALQVVAIGTVFWWMAHLVGFIVRSAPESVDSGRRDILASIGKTALFGVALSLPMTALSNQAMAFCGQCTKNADCGYGFVCKNTAPVNSGEVCNECVAEKA